MNDSAPEQANDQDAPRPSPPPSAGVLCPYCGTSQPAAEVAASGVCKACRNRMDPMARIATHNAMGPWFVRDLSNPFAPGCSYETLGAMCVRGRVKLNSVVRGPTTQQFWRLAAHTPGVAVLLGQCHACAERVPSDAERCHSCDALLRPTVPVGVGRFTSLDDRQQLGLPPVSAKADASDPHAALDELTQVLGHAGSARAGSAPQPNKSLAPPRDPIPSRPPQSTQTRLLGAALVVAIVLLLGLSLWAVVLPALGVKTGVEEITGLAADRADRSGDQANASTPASTVRTEPNATDRSAQELDTGNGPPVDDASMTTPAQTDPQPPADADEPAIPTEVTEPSPSQPIEPGMTDRIRALHHAALSGELNDLQALRDAVATAAREALGEQATQHPDFATRFPALAALHAWAERAIAERMALDALGVP